MKTKEELLQVVPESETYIENFSWDGCKFIATDKGIYRLAVEWNDDELDVRLIPLMMLS